MGGSLLHGLSLVGLPNIYIIYIYIYIYIYINQKMGLGPWGRWAHSGFFFYKYNTVFYREYLLFFVIPGIFNKLVHSIFEREKTVKEFCWS